VTTYLRYGHSALIVLANFGAVSSTIELRYNWKALGLDASEVNLRAPELRVPVQPGQDSIEIGGWIIVPALTHGAIDSREGLILILEKKQVHVATNNRHA